MTEQKAIEWDGNHLLVSRGGPMTYRVADTADLCAALDQNAAAREHVIFYFYPNGPVSDLRAECSRLRTELGELRGALEFLANDSELFDLWVTDEGERCCEMPTEGQQASFDTAPEALLAYAKRRGWTTEAKP